MTKKCTKCGIDKSLEEFSRRSDSKVGYCSRCKSCISKYQKKHYLNNKDRYNTRTNGRKRALKSSGICVECGSREPTEGRIRCNVCRHKDNKRARERHSALFRKDPQFTIAVRSRRSARRVIKAIMQGKTVKTEELLGISFNELNEYLLNNAAKIGITPVETLNGQLVHLDHIFPLHKLDLTNPIHFKLATNYRNLRYIYAVDNLSRDYKELDDLELPKNEDEIDQFFNNLYEAIKC